MKLTHKEYCHRRCMWACALYEALMSDRVRVTRSGEFVGLSLLPHVVPRQLGLDFT